MYNVLFPDSIFDARLVLLFLAVGMVRALSQSKKVRRRRVSKEELDKSAQSLGWIVSRPVPVYKNFLFFKIPIIDRSAPVGEVDPAWLKTLDSTLFDNSPGYVSVVLSGVCGKTAFRALEYVIPGGKNDPTEYHSVVLVPLESKSASVVIRQENMLTRITDVVTDGDIDFEDEEFSKSYKVTSPDRKEAYGVVSQEVIEMVKELAPERLTWAPGCLVWSQRAVLDVATVADVLPRLLKIALSKQ